jgi:hypothetical protein
MFWIAFNYTSAGRKARWADPQRSWSGRDRNDGDVGPGSEGLDAAGVRICGGVTVSTAKENVGDLVMGGKEALNLPQRLEPLHDPLSAPGWLIAVFGPVSEALVLRCSDPGMISRVAAAQLLSLSVMST